MFKLIVCSELGSNASVFPQNTIPNGIMGLECQLPRKRGNASLNKGTSSKDEA